MRLQNQRKGAYLGDVKAGFPEEEMPAMPVYFSKELQDLNRERGRVFWLEGIS